MNIDITTPGLSPVSLDSLKTFLRMNLTSTAEDELLTEWLETATELLSEATGYVPTATGFTLTLTEWPTDGVFCVPRRPITSLTGITYRDSDSNEIDMSDAYVQLSSGRVQLRHAKPEGDMDKITVEFTAGDVTTCPAKFLTVVKLLASHYYSNREAYTDTFLTELPLGFEFVTRQLRGSLGVGGK
ncbi:head-tail connector protein [Limnoglobus roseus]|uniref:Phage gp6-like head-tail connector protein n=1 Tax=Limnoglobus roseus TaxID=2598579 RepID=A0A5C1A6M6_9BACT|nr:head-tail connector protein [Limnoglobus roseus]QEL13877.1 hypothetical protein PX52LOC_00735 [Limnoglobus roseus]